jgi:Family of unknown function (DUF5995)
VDIDTLAARRPENIDDALDCMEMGLRFFHETHDRRAIFLRLYYLMTLEVYKAIHGCKPYEGSRTFLDPGWVHRLSGHFSSLYFESLTAPKSDRAWWAAHHIAEQPRSTVVQNAILGINAHINFDLPRAIATNLNPAELPDYKVMQKRKFDHDQVNDLLVRTINPVQRMMARNYEPGVAVIDLFMGRFDERACAWLLRTYRQQVWWNALAFAAAAEGDEKAIVRSRLEVDSYRLAKRITRSPIWTIELAANRVVRPFLSKRWAAVPLEGRCHDHRPVPDAAALAQPPDEIRCSTPSA